MTLNPKQKYSVLVVEDDESSHRSLIKLLQHIGYRASSATTLREAMALVAERPQCVLLDLMLPDGNGLEVLKHIREHRLPIRVAVITGAPQSEEAQIAQAMSPDIYFVKPVDPPQLMTWLRSVR